MQTQKPWLENYDRGVPHTLEPYPQKTIMDFVKETASQRPFHTFLYFKGNKIPYGTVESLSDFLAAGLSEMGVKKGDRVAIVMPNTPQYVIAELGIWKAGGIVASINPLYTGFELEHALNECGAQVVIVLSLFYQKIKEVQAKTQVKRVIVANIKEYLPTHLKLLFTLLKEGKEGHRVTLQGDDVMMKDLLSRFGGAAPPRVEIQPEDDALILFTGGTTGLSKAAVGSHLGLVQSGMQIYAWFQNTLQEYEDVFLTALPLFHVFAAAGVQMAAIVSRGSMALVPNPRDLDDVMDTIEKSKTTFFPSVPTMFNALVNNPRVQSGKVDLTSIKLCISGASALLQDTKERFEALTSSRIVEGYALTESMMAICCTPVEGKYKVGSVGMPAPDVSVRIADVETGEETLPLGSDHVGEIVISAPQLMRGYYNRADATQAVSYTHLTLPTTPYV
jgi:long-chain acyl-CoA synthetase